MGQREHHQVNIVEEMGLVAEEDLVGKERSETGHGIGNGDASVGFGRRPGDVDVGMCSGETDELSARKPRTSDDACSDHPVTVAVHARHCTLMQVATSGAPLPIRQRP